MDMTSLRCAAALPWLLLLCASTDELQEPQAQPRSQHLEILPRTCEQGSPSRNFRFCDPALPLPERAKDLRSRLSVSEKLSIWNIAMPASPYLPRLNLKGFVWDSTDVCGICLPHIHQAINMTVFPTPIALGATFSRQIVQKVSQATVVEARVASQIHYNSTQGKSIIALVFDGGPLANSAHVGKD